MSNFLIKLVSLCFSLSFPDFIVFQLIFLGVWFWVQKKQNISI